MVLDIKNVGKIKEAEIALEGITIVAGPNASGKSTISKAFYLINIANEEAWKKGSLEKERSMNAVIREFLLSLPQYRRMDIGQRRRLRLALLNYIRSDSNTVETLVSILKNINIFTTDEIERYRDYFEQKRYELKTRDSQYYINYAVHKMILNVFKEQLNYCGENSEAHIECRLEEDTIYMDVKENRVVEFAGSLSLDGDRITIYISTSDLADIMKYYRSLSPEAQQELDTSINVRLAIMLYENKMGNLTAEEAEKAFEQKKWFDQILNQVIDGKIEVQNGKLQYYENQNQSQSKIEFVNMASGMKIFFILKRLIENGTLLDKINLIIDEPESNLHPEWQLKLAELLVLLHRHLDVRLYINSHSPYFVRAIEYYTNQYDLTEKVKFYDMKEIQDSGLFTVEDVTKNIDTIYKHLSKPLNDVM